MCNECFKTEKKQTTTIFTVEVDHNIIVIRNVPCFECPLCGEITFSDEVSAKLESIIAAVRAVAQDVAVIDYSKAA